jgi:hypothetical protein
LCYYTVLCILQPVEIPDFFLKKIELSAVAHQATISDAPSQQTSGAPLGTAVCATAVPGDALLQTSSGAPEKAAVVHHRS